MQAYAVTIIVPAIEVRVPLKVMAEHQKSATVRAMMHWLRGPDVPPNFSGCEVGFVVIPTDLPADTHLDKFGVAVQ